MVGSGRRCRKRDISVEILMHTTGHSKYNILKQPFVKSPVNNAPVSLHFTRGLLYHYIL